MDLLEVPLGNGQEVYISPEWLSARDEDYLPIPDEADTPGKIERRAVVDYLTSLGYEVITDSSQVSEDTFFFSPCRDLHINASVDEYVEKKVHKIHESLEPTNVHEPLTLKFEEDHFPENIPPLPFVLKNEVLQGGTDKILIKTPKQLAIFKKFYEEINDYSFQQTIEEAREQYHLGPEVEFYEDGSSNSFVGIGRINYQQRLYEEFVMQEYIETPTKFNTSLRVVTSSSKDILCSSLKYSKTSKGKRKHLGLVDRYLCEATSPYYLGSKSVTSNTVSGGKSITLGENNYSKEEKRVLLAHGIDPENATVPKDVEEAALSIAVNCRREIGAISGIDFIYDYKNNVWKYLEQQEYPMMYTYCKTYGLPYTTSASDYKEYQVFIEKQRRADIDSRLRSLALAMHKKKTTDGYSEKKLTI
ncbi:MAG: hypothetical protein K2G03_00010 [Bacilli bacterium]|nr:hypothetical protein [Bacilli bacterium]